MCTAVFAAVAKVCVLVRASFAACSQRPARRGRDGLVLAGQAQR